MQLTLPAAPSPATRVPSVQLLHGDCLEVMPTIPDAIVHGIICDPPFGPVEFSQADIRKKDLRVGGSWRCARAGRAPVPRFTECSEGMLSEMRAFLHNMASGMLRISMPGTHAFIASNPLMQHHVSTAFESAGWQCRGYVVRLVQTLRGGDRPKNAHTEFANATVLPRSKFEPWLLFRKRCRGTVAQNLRAFGTGALRRRSADLPFSDVIQSARTGAADKHGHNHPTAKPIAFMMDLIEHIMPGDGGCVLDACSGSAATAVAALRTGRNVICIEKDPGYFEVGRQRVAAEQARLGHPVTV